MHRNLHVICLKSKNEYCHNDRKSYTTNYFVNPKFSLSNGLIKIKEKDKYLRLISSKPNECTYDSQT